MVNRPGLITRARLALAKIVAPHALSIKSGDNAAMIDLFGGEAVAGVPVTEHTAMKMTAAMACVRIMSSIAASLDLRVERRDGKMWIHEPEHPLADFLNWPNEQESDYVFQERIGRGLHVQGNAIAKLRRRGDFRPAEAQVLTRENVVRVFRHTDRRLKYQLQYVDLGGVQRSEVVDQDHILHVPGFGFDGYWAPSPVTHYASEALGLGLAAQRHQGSMFANGVRPSGTITFPEEASDEAVSKTKAAYEKFKGTENAGGVLPLYSGAEFKAITFNSQEAELIASRVFSVEDVSRVWGVPLHLINASQKTTSWGTGMLEQTLAFLRFSLNPHLVRSEGEYTRKLLRNDERGKFRIRHDVSVLMRGTPAQQMELLVKATGGPIQTLNEGRAEIGKPPIEGGDEIRTAPGTAPDDKQAGDPAPTPEPDDD